MNREDRIYLDSILTQDKIESKRIKFPYVARRISELLVAFNKKPMNKILFLQKAKYCIELPETTTELKYLVYEELLEERKWAVSRIQNYNTSSFYILEQKNKKSILHIFTDNVFSTNERTYSRILIKSFKMFINNVKKVSSIPSTCLTYDEMNFEDHKELIETINNSIVDFSLEKYDIDTKIEFIIKTFNYTTISAKDSIIFK